MVVSAWCADAGFIEFVQFYVGELGAADDTLLRLRGQRVPSVKVMEIFLGDHVAAAGERGILPANERGFDHRWFRAAPMVPGWWFPDEDLDHESIAFEMLFGGAGEIAFPRKIGADAWFSFRGAERYEIQEQSFLLPNDQVLTLLTVPTDALG